MVSEDKSDRALKEFLAESEEIIENIYLDLLGLDEAPSDQSPDPELVNNIFRGAHSLKGLCGMFGFETMGDLAHHLENMLDGLRLGKIQFTAEVFSLLFDAVTRLRELLQAKGSGDPSEKNVDDLVNRIENFLKPPETNGNSESSPFASLKLDPATLNVLTEYEEYRLQENIRQNKNIFKVSATFDLMTFNTELDDLNAKIKPMGELITTLPSSSPTSEMEISFDLVIGSSKTIDEIASEVSGGPVKVEQINEGSAKEEKWEELLPVEEQPDDAAPSVSETETTPKQETAQPVEEAGSLRSISQTVRVDIERLDTIMNIVGELVLNKTQIQQIADRLRGDMGFMGSALELYKANRELERKLSDLQAAVMDVRMVPLQQVFDKLARVVRKLSKSSGKEFNDLIIRGAETELDKLIIEELGDPLMHIIRNSIDHGIEPPSERERIGKPRAGTIELDAYQQGNHVVIEVTDDGRGLDIEKIREKAISRGLMKADQKLNEEDIVNFLYEPGFSTAEAVSQVSGRGVGLDVVKQNISLLSGMIDINSEKGKGSKFKITLPITLAIIKALIIKSCGKTYAIPLNSIVESLLIDKSSVKTIEKREVITRHEQVLPLLRLSDLFDLPQKEQDLEEFYVVVVGLAERKFGIIVDNLMGQQDVVIKSLGSTLRRIKGIAGATDLGDQGTILVLDVVDLTEEMIRMTH